MMLPQREGYEVIRFVERGDVCYISTDYIRGTTLYQWIKANASINKKVLQDWIKEILAQLILFHKQPGNPDYNFLNPYNIIITGKNKIVLASIEDAKKNVDWFVEKYFIPVNRKQNRDVYCFGKIIQFIMAHTECEPCLTRKEEYQLLKIVKKCLEADSEDQFRNIQMIQKFYKDQTRKTKESTY